MLGHCLRRWPNIYPTWVQRLVPAELVLQMSCVFEKLLYSITKCKRKLNSMHGIKDLNAVLGVVAMVFFDTRQLSVTKYNTAFNT